MVQSGDCVLNYDVVGSAAWLRPKLRRAGRWGDRKCGEASVFCEVFLLQSGDCNVPRRIRQGFKRLAPHTSPSSTLRRAGAGNFGERMLQSGDCNITRTIRQGFKRLAPHTSPSSDKLRRAGDYFYSSAAFYLGGSDNFGIVRHILD